jgi:hypothetical protein
MMKPTEQTNQQVERFLRKVAQKFPFTEDSSLITDIHLRVSQDSGDLVAFDDEDEEITRCVVEQWIENQDEDFYPQVAEYLRGMLKKMSDTIDHLGILKPYSFVLEDDEKEPQGELYLADDDTVILGGDLMQGLDKDLDDFYDKLVKED